MAQPKEFVQTKCQACGTRVKRVNGRWLAWIRKKAGRTMRDVAARAKISAAHVNDVEKNKRTCPRKLRMVYSNIYRRLQQEGEVSR